MHANPSRHWRAIALSLAALGASSTAAIAAPQTYCDPLVGCKSATPTHFLKVSPGTVKRGKVTTLHGSVGHGCKTPGRVTIYSRAFKGATTHEFAGTPAVYATANKKGAFSKPVRIKRGVKLGTYHVGARCGGGNLGSAKLKIT